METSIPFFVPTETAFAVEVREKLTQKATPIVSIPKNIRMEAIGTDYGEYI